MHYLNILAGGRDKTCTKNEDGKATFTPAVIATERFTAHQLRHTYATMLYDAGVESKTSQKLLDHGDIQVTMKIYNTPVRGKGTTGYRKSERASSDRSITIWNGKVLGRQVKKWLAAIFVVLGRYVRYNMIFNDFS